MTTPTTQQVTDADGAAGADLREQVLLDRDGLVAIAAGWLARGGRVVGPVTGRAVAARAPLGPRTPRVRFAPVTDPELLVLDGFVHATNSAKPLVMPMTEKLYGYRREGRSVELTPGDPPPAPTLLIGARPCDAAAFPILDKVMRWDGADPGYERRREALTVVTLACTAWDEHCFCTSVGLGPAATRGSDLLLTPDAAGGWRARVLTDRGARLTAAASGEPAPAVPSDPVPSNPAPSDPVPDDAGLAPSGPPVRVDVAAATRAMRASFDQPAWAEAGRQCTGCGACTYTCPTCHCFDIADEAHGLQGARRRNWDSCQFASFTAHASGHNPRPDQASRQRQRLRHKFVTYPDLFQDLLCTGCGNCYRACPANLGVLQVLRALAVGSPSGPDDGLDDGPDDGSADGSVATGDAAEVRA